MQGPSTLGGDDDAPDLAGFVPRQEQMKTLLPAVNCRPATAALGEDRVTT
jgi:hypothetical protein